MDFEFVERGVPILETLAQQLCDTHTINSILQLKPMRLEDGREVPKAHGYQGQPRGWVTVMGQLQIGTCHLPL